MFVEILANKIAFCHLQMERPKKDPWFCEIPREGIKYTRITVKEICPDCNCGTKEMSFAAI